MTRTSKVLKRLGIAGLAVVTIGAGVPALTSAASAAANDPSTIFIRPSSQNGTPGTCLNYVVNAYDSTGAASANATITVTLTPQTGLTPSQDVDFCQTAQTPEPNGTTALGAANGTAGAAPSTPSNVQNGAANAPDQGTFKANASGQFTFGVFSNQTGTVSIQAFFDANNSGSFTAGEPQSQATANYGAGGPAGSNAQADVVRCVDATPNTATNPTNDPHTFQAFLTNQSTSASTVQPTPGATVHNSSSPATPCIGNPVPGVTPVFTVTDTDGTPAATLGPIACTQSDNNGIATCTYTRSTTTTDTINVYVNQSNGATAAQEPAAGTGCAGVSGPGTPTPCEPGDVINKTYIAAQTGNTVTVTCAPDAGAGGGATGATDNNGSANNTTPAGSSCTNNVSDGDRAFTASVTNGSPAVNSGAGILIRFTVTGDATPKTFDCTTAASGQCSVLITDADPVAGEKQVVTATVRGTSSAGSATLTFTNLPGDARNIALAPKGATLTPQQVQTYTATVTDLDGKPVPGATVTFGESGPGFFRNNATNVVTDANGQATVDFTSGPSETGTNTITATITSTSQCASTTGNGAAAGGTAPQGGFAPTGAKAGNCSDTAGVTISNASPTPTATASGGRQALTLTVLTPSIPAGSTGQLRATGAANQGFQLECYTRPSTTFVASHPGTFDAAGDPVTFTLALGRNTRCFIEYTTNSTQGASPSVVINVRTVLSFSAIRTAVRTYTFQGRNLPRASGQLITLYRIDAAGNEIRTSNLTTDASGIFRLSRKFTGTGTFQFRVRTPQTLNNAAGSSVTITVNIH
ncbi:MAG: Bacterial Ig-like domain (group 1) [Frankiales bacterium]|nr:Bacterial Ig-like domain (group 1) [Frankiales bacterium]